MTDELLKPFLDAGFTQISHSNDVDGVVVLRTYHDGQGLFADVSKNNCRLYFVYWMAVMDVSFSWPHPRFEMFRSKMRHAADVLGVH